MFENKIERFIDREQAEALVGSVGRRVKGLSKKEEKGKRTHRYRQQCVMEGLVWEVKGDIGGQMVMELNKEKIK